jgi:hypothetical protein
MLITALVSSALANPAPITHVSRLPIPGVAASGLSLLQVVHEMQLAEALQATVDLHRVSSVFEARSGETDVRVTQWGVNQVLAGLPGTAFLSLKVEQPNGRAKRVHCNVSQSVDAQATFEALAQKCASKWTR